MSLITFCLPAGSVNPEFSGFPITSDGSYHVVDIHSRLITALIDFPDGVTAVYLSHALQIGPPVSRLKLWTYPGGHISPFSIHQFPRGYRVADSADTLRALINEWQIPAR